MCEGYERQRIFVAHEPSASVTKTTRPLVVAPQETPSLRLLPDTVSHAAYDEQTFALFWDIYLPKYPLGPTGSLGVPVSLWTKIVTTLYPNDIALRTALLAIAVDCIGRQFDDRLYTEKGIGLYGKALRETNRALQDPRRAHSDEVLAACRLLGSYEASHPNEPVVSVAGRSEKGILLWLN